MMAAAIAIVPTKTCASHLLFEGPADTTALLLLLALACRPIVVVSASNLSLVNLAVVLSFKNVVLQKSVSNNSDHNYALAQRNNNVF
eukprot:m.299700 g.299700  ORF g.299700 m.299700 type:complete len:87 (+) comp15873_c0_seq1:2111-2371(+)